MAGTMRAGNNLACVHQFVEGGPQAGGWWLLTSLINLRYSRVRLELAYVRICMTQELGLETLAFENKCIMERGRA